MAAVPVRIFTMPITRYFVLLPSVPPSPTLYKTVGHQMCKSVFSLKGNYGSHQQECDEQSAGNEFRSEEAVYTGLQL